MDGSLNAILGNNGMRAFRRALRDCAGRPLAYHSRDGFGAVAAAVLERVARGERVHDHEVRELFAHGNASRPPAAANVAVVPMRGVALYDTELFPVCYSTRRLAHVVTALAADPSIATIVLDCDSPGGSVLGVPEAANAIYAAAQKKRVVSLVTPLCASAAYWISSASEIIAVPSSDIGSIGVFMAHTDCSKFNEMNGMKITYIFAGENKVEGNSDEPLSDEAREHFQSEVDAIYDQFTKAVARGRKKSQRDVIDNFGKGRCMSAKDAVRCGMIDHVAPNPEAAFALALQPALLRAAQFESLRHLPSARSDAAAARRRRLDMLQF